MWEAGFLDLTGPMLSTSSKVSTGRPKARNRAPAPIIPRSATALESWDAATLCMSLTWEFHFNTAIAHDPRPHIAEGYHYSYRIGNCGCSALGWPRAFK